MPRQDGPPWDIPDLMEPQAPGLAGQADREPGKGAARGVAQPVLDDEDLFGSGDGALELELGSRPPPPPPPPAPPPDPAVGGEPPPAAKPKSVSPPAPPDTPPAEELVPEESEPGPEVPRPRAPVDWRGMEGRSDVRLRGLAEKYLPQVASFAGRVAPTGFLAGSLLVLGSLLASVGGCSYLALTGERVRTGAVSGTLLVVGLVLIARSFARGQRT